MLKMNNAFILIFGFSPPPASYLATKRIQLNSPKVLIFFFSGAVPVTCQTNTHLCITALEYIIGYISMLLK